MVESCHKPTVQDTRSTSVDNFNKLCTFNLIKPKYLSEVGQVFRWIPQLLSCTGVYSISQLHLHYHYSTESCTLNWVWSMHALELYPQSQLYYQVWEREMPGKLYHVKWCRKIYKYMDGTQSANFVLFSQLEASLQINPPASQHWTRKDLCYIPTTCLLHTTWYYCTYQNLQGLTPLYLHTGSF